MRSTFGIVAAAAALALPAAPAAAQPAAAAAQSPAPRGTVSIPFAPPVGVPLRYRVERSTLAPGRPANRAALDFVATFARAGEGYRMSVNYVVPGGAGGAGGGDVDPAAALMLRPLAFRLGADATVLGLEDEAAYWSALEAAADRSLAARGAATPELRERLRAFLGDLRALPDAERLAKIGEIVLPIVAMAGADLDTGEADSVSGPVETPFGRLTADVTQSVERIEGGIAHASTVARINPADAEAMMRAGFARFAGEGAALPEIRVTAFDDEERAEVSIETGLARRYEARRSVELEIAGQRERVGTIVTVTAAN